jgi:hypothetical protein
MTDKTLEILGLLQAECNDVVELITKIRRSGLEAVDADGVSGLQLLEQEIADIYLLVAVLMETEVLNVDKLEAIVTQKANEMGAAQQNSTQKPASLV